MNRLIFFISIFCCYFLSQTLGNKNVSSNVKKIEVTRGGNIYLKCDVNIGRLTENLLWQSGSVLLASGNKIEIKSERFRLEPTALVILNATLKDSRLFTCSDSRTRYSVFQVIVNDLFCHQVSQVANAEVYYHPPANENGEFKYGSRVSYQCQPGFELIGEETRYCNDPQTNWSGKSPKCKDSYLIKLENRIKQLEKQSEKLATDINLLSSNQKIIKDETQYQYSLWEYLHHDTASFKRYVNDQINKVNLSLQSLRAIRSGILVRKPLIPRQPVLNPRY